MGGLGGVCGVKMLLAKSTMFILYVLAYFSLKYSTAQLETEIQISKCCGWNLFYSVHLQKRDETRVGMGSLCAGINR